MPLKRFEPKEKEEGDGREKILIDKSALDKINEEDTTHVTVYYHGNIYQDAREGKVKCEAVKHPFPDDDITTHGQDRLFGESTFTQTFTKKHFLEVFRPEIEESNT